MSSRSPAFERFLIQVHRRFVAFRVLERTGLGVLAGCAAGVPLVAAAVWRSIDAGPLAVGALTVGAAAGFIAGVLHRPSLHEAAIETDRQLETSDLLGTALSLRRDPDPFAAAVIDTANHWSRNVSPAAVILNRLGARAWGGIGLATALLVVLTLLPNYANPTHAADQPFSPTSARIGELPASLSSSDQRGATPEKNPEDLRSNRDSPLEEAPRPQVPSGNSNDTRAPGRGRDAAQGRGESRTASRSQNLPKTTDAIESANSSPNGRGAGGVGRAANNALPGDDEGSQTSGSKSATSRVPWNSPQWPRQAQQALQALEAGQVPDAYRDVIRDYFDSH